MASNNDQEIAAGLTSDDSSDDNVSHDVKDMAKLGKKQQLLRQFDFWSILGFVCVTMLTWEGLFNTFIYGLANGGPAGLVYGFVFVWLGYGFVIVSLAELMSMWPTSGGQYHWTYTLSPPGIATVMSYICGWQAVVGWQGGLASAAYLAATMTQGLVVLNYPEVYVFQRWHGTLIIYAVLIICALMGTVGHRMLPMLDRAALVVHLAGFIVVIVVIAVLSPTKASANEVFDVWLNNGYNSQGLSFMVGLQGLVFAWLGADGPIHMAEEIKNSSRVVPWSLVGSIVVNGILGFGMILVILFYGPSGDALVEALQSPTGFPYIAIFTYASGSVAGGTGLTAIVIFMTILCVVMVYTAASRELWAFARDNGLPGSRILARVDGKTKLPLWCILTSTIIPTLLALINIVSAVAFNAILSLTVACFMGSYGMPIVLVVWRRIQALRGKGPPLPWGPWRLGVWGIPINALAICWLTVIFIFSFFPVEPLPGLTVQTMNRSSLAYAVLTLLAAVFYVLFGRHRYKGPVRDAVGGEIEAVLGWGEKSTS